MISKQQLETWKSLANPETADGIAILKLVGEVERLTAIFKSVSESAARFPILFGEAQEVFDDLLLELDETQ